MFELHTYPEHYEGLLPGVKLFPSEPIERRFGAGTGSPPCFQLSCQPTGPHLKLSYFVGVDWIQRGEHALHVEPKLDQETGPQTNYLAMLLTALQHPDLLGCMVDLFTIDFEAPPIAIAQSQDLLTPLLIVHFLSVVRRIARKGLRKSYYQIERNYTAAIKGRILVAKTLKRNLVRNRHIDTICSHEEFGLNSLENRLLKRALRFAQRYLPATEGLFAAGGLTSLFSEALSAFDQVSDEATEQEIKRAPTNAFYREYDEGIRLARLILRRFGYNPNRAQPQTEVYTPPYWIDMSKLFELHVLGLLKDAYRHQIVFQTQGNYGRPDFLLCGDQMRMIIDAKYKRCYSNRYEIEDIRQLSGYGRDQKILSQLGYTIEEGFRTVVKCLIIYPAEHSSTDGSTPAISLDQKAAIEGFEQFFKLPVRLPKV